MLTRLIQTARRHAASTTAAFTLVVGSAAFALAQPEPFAGRGPGGPGGRFGTMGSLFSLHVEGLRGLDLTDAQREQVRSIVRTHRDEARALTERGRTAMNALHAATRSATDENAIRQEGEALGALIADAAVLRARVRTEVLSVLTTEQQTRAEQLRGERERFMQERRQRFEKRRQEWRQRRGQDAAAGAGQGAGSGTGSGIQD